MKPQPIKSTSETVSEVEARNKTTQELLKTYLFLPKERREKRFADTARVAEITGLSRRTIQFWIETGLIRAICIGKKYVVDLDSLTEYLSARAEKPTR